MTGLRQWLPLLRSAAGKEARRAPQVFRRQDREDLTSEAYLIYCDALKKYDWHRGRFKHYLRTRLKALKDRTRREVRRHRLAARDWAFDLEGVAAPEWTEPGADLTAFLSADALVLLRLAARSDPNMPPRDVRSALRVYFNQAGWDDARYWRAFHEVQEAL